MKLRETAFRLRARIRICATRAAPAYRRKRVLVKIIGE